MLLQCFECKTFTRIIEKPIFKLWYYCLNWSKRIRYFFYTAADADTDIEREREHKGAIGAESKVMERACRATTKKKRWKREEKSYKPPKACRENGRSRREGGRKSRSTCTGGRVGVGGAQAEMRTCRDKKRNRDRERENQLLPPLMGEWALGTVSWVHVKRKKNLNESGAFTCAV